MRRYAEDTTVPMAKSRAEIDELLRGWGAVGLQWTDDFEHNHVVLRFVWPRDAHRYGARFVVHLPTPAEINEALRSYSGTWTQREARIKRELANRGRREMRLLALWLKAALNAVDAGLVDAETLFLPFLEGKDGRTFAEVAVPRLAELTTGGAGRLLPPAPEAT